MKTALLLSNLSEQVANQMGLYFSEEQEKYLIKGMTAASLELGFNDVWTCIEWLLAHPWQREQIAILSSHLTIGETYFFRDSLCWQILQEKIFPELIPLSRERPIRIWSAGCCTGEEPYSLAILLHHHFHLPQNQFSILATDINPIFLQKAAGGIYGEWSFRDTPSWLKQYFHKLSQNRWEISPTIKNMVQFAYLNLAQDVYPSLSNQTHNMDVIVCRNVLMYFLDKRSHQTTCNFYHSLNEGGWLMVSPTETTLSSLFKNFRAVPFPEGTFYRKIENNLPHPQNQNNLFVNREEKKNIQAVNNSLQEIFPEKITSSETVQSELEIEKIIALSRQFANQGNLREAKNYCEKAIEIRKLDSGLHYFYSMVLEAMGALEKSEQSLKYALYIDPNFILAHFSLANFLKRQGRLGESKKYLDNCLSLLISCAPEEILPHSEGMLAGRLKDIVNKMLMGK